MVPLVILGAGASQGSGEYRPSSIQLANEPLVPPLTVDRQILDLIASAGCEIRHMTIVDQDEATAEDVFRRFEAAGLKSIWRVVADADFATWSSDGELNLLVGEYDGPCSRSV